MDTLQQSILKQIEYFNSSNFKFFEEEHVYTYNNKQLKSVTKFIEQFHIEFPKEVASQKAAIRDGISVAEVLEKWRISNVYSCLLGHKVHKYIEDYYTPDVEPELDLEDDDVCNRVRMFLDEVAPRFAAKRMVPVAQELRIFSEQFGLAGTIDALFLLGDELYMVDWKTSKTIEIDEETERSYFGKKMLPPFQDQWDNNMNHYSIQLSTYRLILQEQGIHVKAGAIVHLPKNGKSQIYKTKDYTDRLSAYFGVSFKKEAA